MTDHEASHVVDDQCCAVIQACTDMLNAAFQIDAEAQLEAIVAAAKALHARATEAHERSMLRRSQQ